MANQVLPVGVVLGGVGLGFPVQQLPADGVIRIHGAGGELLLRLLEGHQQGIGLDVGKVGNNPGDSPYLFTKVFTLPPSNREPFEPFMSRLMAHLAGLRHD